MFRMWDIVVFAFRVKYPRGGRRRRRRDRRPPHSATPHPRFVPFPVLSFVVDNVLAGVIDDAAAAAAAVDYNGVTVALGPCVLDASDPCTSGKVSFYLYARESREEPVKITPRDERPPPGYDPAAETKVLIHGYAGSVDFNGTVIVRKAYQRTGRFNIVVVDWGELVRLPCYPVAVVNTLQAGRCTALLLSRLEAAEFHVVGFSLGAHVAAFASNDLLRLRGRRLNRITGLDPALPFFASLDKSWKLDKDDADFVDVVHTNVGVFGKIEATGHVDFYVNEGFFQPACRDSSNIPLCSHIMALAYFAESIAASDARGFWGVPCSSYFQQVLGWCKPDGESRSLALMGENCDKRSRGLFHVATRERPPFALGRPPLSALLFIKQT